MAYMYGGGIPICGYLIFAGMIVPNVVPRPPALKTLMTQYNMKSVGLTLRV